MVDVPTIAEGLDNPELMARAEQEAERLLDVLKEKVKTDIKDIGTLRKSMQVTIPSEIISNRLDHDYKEIRTEAVLPGFRKGRAPSRLVKKRFGGEVKDQLKSAVLGQSFIAAVQNNKLDVLGDPLFRVEKDKEVKFVEFGDALTAFQLPESGDFSYTCEIEVKPEFDLPELKGIEVKSPKVELTEELVDEHIDRQRKIRGRYEPVTEGAAGDEDIVIADVRLMHDGQLVKEEANVQLGIRPTRLDGIPLMTLDKDLAGVKIGDQRSVKCDIPDDYERADLRGKKAEFEFKVHEIKRLAPISIEDYREQIGVNDDKELRTYAMQELEVERERIIENARKEQVLQYLLASTKVELPENLSARQTDRAVMRRVVDLQQRGVPDHEIEARIDELRTVAKEDVARDLRLEFVLEKIAQKLEIGVTEEEVNSEIARISRLYNQRFDRVRDGLQKRGLLMQLAEQVRQDKCVTALLRDAKVTEVEAEAKPAAKGGKKSKAKAKDAEE